MGFTARMWVPNRRGRCALHYSNPNINVGNVTHISASEATPQNPNSQLLGLPGQHWQTNFGAASITVQNISVRQGAVDFYVFVDWATPLNLVVDMTFIDKPDLILSGT
ncbi:MAG: hypothetical protein P0Y66_21750 [Candidatus Kaistia colombiensis]|nr:MAG: hypothetical protein P0Y66_21750 [Kaistia sp.]